MANLEIYKKPESLAKYEDPKTFIAMAPRQANRDLRHIKTENDVLLSVQKSETPSIARLKKHHGEDAVIAYICIWLSDLNMSLGVKNPMSDPQNEECAFFILDDYYYLTMADFKLFFTSIKKGKFGKLYESLTMAKILEWLEEYVINRTRLFEQSIPEEKKEIRQRSINATGSVKELTEKLDIRKSLKK